MRRTVCHVVMLAMSFVAVIGQSILAVVEFRWYSPILLLVAPVILYGLIRWVPKVPQIYRQELREQRRRENRCLNCGYSLEGLTSERCPECGTPTTERDEKEQKIHDIDIPMW